MKLSLSLRRKLTSLWLNKSFLSFFNTLTSIMSTSTHCRRPFSRLHPLSQWGTSERVRNRGQKGGDNFIRCGGPPAPHRHTPNKYLKSVWFNVWALSGHSAQQCKSISASCIWRGVHLFWSSLHQAGVKIAACILFFFFFILNYLRCTWFHRLVAKWCREKQFNALSVPNNKTEENKGNERNNLRIKRS